MFQESKLMGDGAIRASLLLGPQRFRAPRVRTSSGFLLVQGLQGCSQARPRLDTRVYSDLQSEKQLCQHPGEQEGGGAPLFRERVEFCGRRSCFSAVSCVCFTSLCSECRLNKSMDVFALLPFISFILLFLTHRL